VEFSVQTAWQDLTRRLAVVAGAGGALVSLLNDAPVNIAAMRGAGAFFGLLLVAKIASSLMNASSESAVQNSPSSEGEES
jgi:hypothetical protein